MENKKFIDEENPREAKGVLNFESNAALAARDYNIPCSTIYCITVVKGYWIWWCSSHHQPYYICEKNRLLQNNILINKNGRK